MVFKWPNAFVGKNILLLPRHPEFLARGFRVVNARTLKPFKPTQAVPQSAIADKDKKKKENEMLLEGLRKMMQKQNVEEKDDRFTQMKRLY